MIRLNLHQQFISFLVAACLLIAGLTAWQVRDARQTRIDEMQQLAASAADVAQQQFLDALEVAEVMMRNLRILATAREWTPARLGEIRAMLRMQLDPLPQFSDSSLFDAKGRLLAHSAPFPEPLQNVANQDFFIHHAAHKDEVLLLSAPMTSRTSPQLTVPLTARLNRPDGSFAGVFAVGLKHEFLGRLYGRLNLGEDAAIGIYLQDGSALMQWPASGQFFNIPNQPLQLFASMLAEGRTHDTMSANGEDGVERFFNVRKVAGYPVFVAAGISTGQAMAAWDKEATQQIASSLLISVVLALAGMWLNRRVARRSEIERKLSQANQKLEEIALLDGLTGIANRRCFDNTFAQEFNRARRNGRPLALILLDVDHFKQYNDRYGHLAGDECLKRVASEICRVAARRPADLVARYGGEEFVVLLPESGMESGLIVAERMRNAVQALAIEHADNPLGVVTLSAGVNAFQPVKESDELQALLMATDGALYQSKKGGRNRIPPASSPKA